MILAELFVEKGVRVKVGKIEPPFRIWRKGLGQVDEFARGVRRHRQHLASVRQQLAGL